MPISEQFQLPMQKPNLIKTKATLITPEINQSRTTVSTFSFLLSPILFGICCFLRFFVPLIWSSLSGTATSSLPSSSTLLFAVPETMLPLEVVLAVVFFSCKAFFWSRSAYVYAVLNSSINSHICFLLALTSPPPQTCCVISGGLWSWVRFYTSTITDSKLLKQRGRRLGERGGGDYQDIR